MVSVIFHYVQTVIDALKVGDTSCYVNEGKEVSGYRKTVRYSCGTLSDMIDEVAARWLPLQSLRLG